MNDRLWELLAKYYTNRLTTEEKVELEELLLDFPDNWLKAGLLQQIRWRVKPILSEERKEIIIDRILERGGAEEWPVDRKNHLRFKRRGTVRAIALTVSLAVIVGLVIVVRYKPVPKAEGGWQQISTADGTKSVLHLPDGSEVWLNAGSSLRYPDNFDKTKREIYLKGEAYFIVKHDAAKPFIVHAASMNIDVLGTEFDVKAYPDESFSETSLIKGSVEVILKQGHRDQRIYLKPDQKVMIRNEQGRIQDLRNKDKGQLPSLQDNDSTLTNVVLQPIKKIDHITPETAWKENMLVFEDESLFSLVQRLDRWYGVNIIIKDTALAKQHFTGRADNVSLEKLLQILQMIKPFQYTIQDKNVIIQ